MSVDIGASQTKSDPNVVPLCDILLVLLIIFMVITPTLQKGIDIKLPEKVEAEQGQSTANTIMLVIEDSGKSLRLNQMAIEKDFLELRLREVFNVRSDKTLFIRVDEDTPYKQVMEILDIVRGAGIETLGLIPEHYKTGLN